MNRRGFLLLIIFFLNFCFRIDGQTNGDYRSHQSGTWSDVANWEKYDGSSWVYPATEFPILANPWITSRVTIQSGHTITASGIIGGNTGGILEIMSGGTLNMGSNAIRGTSQLSKFPQIIINGTLNTSSYVSSSTFMLSATGKFVTSYIGTRGWWYSGYYPTVYTLDGTIEFAGITEQKIPNFNYKNVIVSGSGDKVPSETAITIEGTLTIASGSRFVLAGAVFYCNGGGIVLDGVLDGAASSIEFNGGNQVISGNGSFSSLTDAMGIGTSTTTNLSITNPNLITLSILVIVPGSTLSIGADSKVTVLGSVDTGDGLLLKASTTSPYSCASLIIDPAAEVIGNVHSELYLTGGGSSFLGNYKWHYISSPFASLNISAFTAVTNNLAQYIESRPSTALIQGWVNYYGYSYYNQATTTITFNNLNPGQGYDFYDSQDNLLTLSGSLNIDDVIFPLGFSGIPEEVHGFNLLGNPFTSGLDWDLIANDPSYPLNTSKAINFTRENAQCSYVNGVGIPSDVTGIIPPMQGFFIKTTTAGNSITLASSARTHSDIHQRYKGNSVIPIIRLALSETTDPNDETVVRFDEDAKTYFDNDFDAVKMFLASDKTTIHTESAGTDFSINGLPIPPEGSVTEIPVVINLTSDGLHKINASQIQGLDNFNVYLKDNTTGVSTNLKTTPEISFSAPDGSTTRFTLRVANVVTGIEDPILSTKAFSIYNGYGFITILPVDDKWNGLKGSIRVFDVTGKTISNITEVEFTRNTPILIKSPVSSGVFIVEIRSGILKYTGKVMVN